MLSGRNIFKYFNKFNPMDYRPVFRDLRIRDDFNAGLKQLKDNGKFNAIYQKYLGDRDRN